MALSEGWLVPGFSFDTFISTLVRTDLVSFELTASAPILSECVAYSPTLDLWISSGFDETSGNIGVFYSKDAGDSWTFTAAPFGSAGFVEALVWTGSRFLAVAGNTSVAGQTPLLSESLDGITWSDVSTPMDGVSGYRGEPPGGALVPAFFSCVSGSGDNWFAGGPSLFPGSGSFADEIAVAVCSSDGGHTWSLATMPTVTDQVGSVSTGSVSHSFWDGAKFIGLQSLASALTANSVYTSADGSVWELAGLGPLVSDSDYTDDVAFTLAKPADELLMFTGGIDFLGVTNPLYWTSSDDGATWAGPFDDTAPAGDISQANYVVHGVMFRQGLGFDDETTAFLFARGAPSPWSSLDTGVSQVWYGTGGSMPYLDYGKFGATPLRRYPRNDGLGASTQRRLPPPTSTQSGLRRGPTAIT